MDGNDEIATKEANGDEAEAKALESPKPLAFTIDFGEGKIDSQRHIKLVEKLRHRRGQSLSKLEIVPTPSPPKNKNGPKIKSTHTHADGYFSSDERSEYGKNVRANGDDPKPCDKMTQSCVLPRVASPKFDLTTSYHEESSRTCEEYEYNSDSVSETGTYTLDADNYSEEQKARMSIDKNFRIEREVNVARKTEDYVRSLLDPPKSIEKEKIEKKVEEIVTPPVVKPQTLDLSSGSMRLARFLEQKQKVLSPILSPTQQISITQSNLGKKQGYNNLDNEGRGVKNLLNQIMFPKEKTSQEGGAVDQGNIISVTSSGAFRSRSDRGAKHMKNFCLSKSGVQIEAYTENKYQNEIVVHAALTLNKNSSANLTANVIHVSDNLSRDKSNLTPDSYCGKHSPTKIPSPIRSLRPRSRDLDLSDSSLETDSYLRPTQNIIKSLQQRLSIDSDHEISAKYLNNDARNLLKRPSHLRHNSFDDKNLKISNKLEHFQNKNLQSIDQTYNVLNHYKSNKIQNSPNNSPIRRSSSFSTKLQNNSSKNLNVAPSTKETNVLQSPSLSGRNVSSAGSIQRSASTTNIKPNLAQARRSSITSSDQHHKIDRNAFGDTESSSEEDYDKNQKRKDITNTRYNRAFSLRRGRLDAPEPTGHPRCPNTPEMRRKFPTVEQHHHPHQQHQQHQQHHRPERAISVDRRPVKTNEVSSRYLQSVASKKPSKVDLLPPKSTPTTNASAKSKLQGFSRTDTGRFSMRSSSGNTPKNLRKDHHPEKKQSGGRSNSSLSSREVDFQNWKRRKSYDPMKAAAEGKRKAEMARRQNSLTQSPTDANPDYDSSPSHSSSVHRSQLPVKASRSRERQSRSALH